MSDDKIDALAAMDAAIMRNRHRGDNPGELAMQQKARDAVAALIEVVDGVATHLIGYGEVAEFASRYLRDALDRVRSS